MNFTNGRRPKEVKRFHAEFSSLLEGFALETLETDPNPMCALSSDLRLIYLNPVWLKFGEESGGEPALSKHIEEFERKTYRRALEAGEVCHHDHECSSANVYRGYHEIVYPFHNRSGLLVVRSLVHSRSPPYERWYTGPEGLITQCCQCRRVQRIGEPELWDWVPDWVSRMPFNTTGGLCSICYEYHWKHRARAS
jgi:hypothetical protein